MWTIMLVLCVGFTYATLEHLLNGGLTADRYGHRRPFFSKTGTAGWVMALLFSAMAGGVYLASSSKSNKLLFIAPIGMVGVIILYVYLLYRWHEEGSNWIELALAALLVITMKIPFTITAQATARLIQQDAGGEKLAELILRLPFVCSVAAIGYFVIDRFYYRCNEYLAEAEEAGEDEIAASESYDDASRYHVFGVVAIVVTSLILLTSILSMFVVNFKWPTWSFGVKSATEEQADVDDLTDDDSTMDFDDSWIGDDETTAGGTDIEWVPWYGFYNLSLKGGDTADDYNFGYNLADYKENPTATDYDRDFRDRMKVDPALAAAATAWLDANVGTRYLGEFYESCKHDWAKTINTAKDRFTTDQAAYYNNLDAFFAFLDTGTISVKTGTNLVDQMYMNPYTESGVPDVIVMKTDHPEGLFLVYTFSIKGNVLEVAYRIECGYQPTNVEQVMGIKPQENPVKPDTPQPVPTHSPVNPVVPTATPAPPKPTDAPKPTDVPKPTATPTPEPTPTTVPSTPTPIPPTPTVKPKDPTQGTQDVEPNDDPGPGPDTNNGIGAQNSTKDQPENSDHFDSYDQYRETIQHLDTVNTVQETPSNTNSPSVQIDTPANQPVHIDNGSGGNINEPTTVTTPATVAETGEQITTNPGGAWGGPPD